MISIKALKIIGLSVLSGGALVLFQNCGKIAVSDLMLASQMVEQGGFEVVISDVSNGGSEIAPVDGEQVKEEVIAKENVEVTKEKEVIKDDQAKEEVAIEEEVVENEVIKKEDIKEEVTVVNEEAKKTGNGCSSHLISDILLNVESIYDYDNKVGAVLSLAKANQQVTLDQKVVIVQAIKSGSVSMIKLELASEGNKVLSQGNIELPLKTPSGQQSGIKIKLLNTVQVSAGKLYSLTLDFDENDQILQNSQKCIFKPVIKLATLVAN